MWVRVRDSFELACSGWPFVIEEPLDPDELTWCLHCQRFEYLGDWQFDPESGLVVHGRDGCDGSPIDCFMRGDLDQIEEANRWSPRDEDGLDLN